MFCSFVVEWHKNNKLERIWIDVAVAQLRYMGSEYYHYANPLDTFVGTVLDTIHVLDQW
jgi:hypothetical protein